MAIVDLRYYVLLYARSGDAEKGGAGICGSEFSENTERWDDLEDVDDSEADSRGDRVGCAIEDELDEQARLALRSIRS